MQSFLVEEDPLRLTVFKANSTGVESLIRSHHPNNRSHAFAREGMAKGFPEVFGRNRLPRGAQGKLLRLQAKPSMECYPELVFVPFFSADDSYAGRCYPFRSHSGRCPTSCKSFVGQREPPKHGHRSHAPCAGFRDARVRGIT